MTRTPLPFCQICTERQLYRVRADRVVTVEGVACSLCDGCAQNWVGAGGVLFGDVGFGLDGYPVELRVTGGRLERDTRGRW